MATTTANQKHVLLLCALLAWPLGAAPDKAQEATDSDAGAPGSGWSLRARLGKFERQSSTRDDNYYDEWAGFIRVSNQLDSFWVTSKGTTSAGETDSSEIRSFYSRRVSPYVDWHLGWKRDIKPDPERDWLGFGVLAILPFTVGADVSIFMGESGRTAARLEMAYQHRFTPRLSLTPDLEANFYGEDEPERDIGSGLSDLDLGLRLRYQVIKGVSPYTGVTWKGNFGRTADLLESRGEESDDLRVMMGITLAF